MSKQRVFAPTTLLVAAFLFVMGGILTVSGVSAQGTPEAMGGETPHPAHIHSGTCDTLGDVVFPLNDVSAADVGAAPVASPQTMGTPTAKGTAEIGVSGTPVATPSMVEGEIVAMSTTDVDASLDDILGAEHAVNVHESADNIQNYIACGDITGETVNGSLMVELKELNGSGYTGQAILTDNGDGTTTVDVTLVRSGETGTPVASPAS
jgi:hypothetical protein